jgi:ABC-type transport system involved in multi-copper enzyme maturation permease subunit
VWQIVLGRWIGGSIVVVAVVAPTVALAAVVADAPGLIGPIVLAASVEAVSYLAFFIAIGCITRRAAVWSLAFVFLVERLLGAALTGIAQLSPTWESRAILTGLMDDAPVRLYREGIPDAWSAVGRLALITIVVLALAAWRMRHLRLAGAAD